jgi:hypothetical protein
MITEWAKSAGNVKPVGTGRDFPFQLIATHGQKVWVGKITWGRPAAANRELLDFI